MAVQNIRQITYRYPLLLWVMMFGSIVIWFAHFAFVYNVVDFACASSWPSERMSEIRTVTTLVIVGTVVGSILLIVNGLGAFAVWRDARHEDGESAQVRAFMGLVGIALSLISLAVVIVSTIPVFVLQTCAGVTGV